MKTRVPMWSSASGGIALVPAGWWSPRSCWCKRCRGHHRARQRHGPDKFPAPAAIAAAMMAPALSPLVKAARAG
ncbi:MAG: hypothetical protein V7646_1388, partial [Pseudonocardia sp.]